MEMAREGQSCTLTLVIQTLEKSGFFLNVSPKTLNQTTIITHTIN
jgi:hypothetical protein